MRTSWSKSFYDVVCNTLRRVPSHHSLEGSKCGVCFLAVFFQLLTFLASDQLWKFVPPSELWILGHPRRLNTITSNARATVSASCLGIGTASGNRVKWSKKSDRFGRSEVVLRGNA
ncbi:uncharacterized protein LOC110835351 [Zootermopsis nevadensis]|uniref:uncharacterized protein LOC110835348 n=1 Tax=Zootermopsis nevadensis TaxID=136037 RepID=UPI000B8E4AA4|nr:uncharacterized protein LOC110835348 [Zootermopsis nevadensis]XP_021931168.1 uncharacterized protein LOC110835351 [Zootermopsis nevadensis]